MYRIPLWILRLCNSFDSQSNAEVTQVALLSYLIDKKMEAQRGKLLVEITTTQRPLIDKPHHSQRLNSK